MFKLLILILLFASCASHSRDNWGPWKVASVPLEEKVWRFCNIDLDGPAYSEKGHCYVDEECRSRETIFGNKREECRPKPLFCKWGDVDCLKRYNIFYNKIINKGVR